MKRRTCWLLHLGLVILKLFEPHASFAIVSTCFGRQILYLLFVGLFLKLLMRNASHSLCDPSQTATRSVKYRKKALPRKSKLDVFDLKNAMIFSANIKFPYADQNMLKRKLCWLLSLIHLLLKTLQLHAMIFLIFSTCFV